MILLRCLLDFMRGDGMAMAIAITMVRWVKSEKRENLESYFFSKIGRIFLWFVQCN